MLFHHNGYVSGDPRVQPAAGVGVDRSPELPETMDVLVVGAGPAGMTATAQLASFPEVMTCLVDRRPQRLEIGQADGIQARSVETFQAFGFAEEIVAEAYHLTEMNFWKPDPRQSGHIIRTARAVDDPAGVSEFPHLIVNQARVLDYFARFARHAPSRTEPYWGWEFVSLEVGEGEYPVTVTLKRTGETAQSGVNPGETRTIRTKYVVGGDGAHSKVRRDIGAQHVGAVSYHAWGVMDVIAETDFPDIRTKCAIQSEHGSILHIPREGGFLFRMYVDLGEVDQHDAGAVRKTPIESIIAQANQIVSPYTVDVKDVAWWSVYEVGHRVTDRFDDVSAEDVGRRHPHVFIAGDACHTHSAKAGQGMNVSIQDAFNLGWKLGHVLTGLSPESLLSTYSAERQPVAQKLIDFDREWSSMMAAKPEELESSTALEDFYQKTAEFPAGFMTEYPAGMLVSEASHQALASGFPLGKRFKAHPAKRVADTTPHRFGHQHAADGRWRIYAFADAALSSAQDSALRTWADWLDSEASPVRRFTPAGRDLDALFDVQVVYQQPHEEVELMETPSIFRPQVGRLQVSNLNKVWGVDPEDDLFEARGLRRDGVIVVVRPDQYVSAVLPLSATDELTDFFEPIFTP
ncbi:FAD-dependent monooxygenase [Citricoccus sp. I39-566]|uniref:FAD-dependent monooxygenase n=1 Tax=Citricoccus sp. I39-566 TaxID=3073268 RepID=UPI00286A3654|nr:FAD-dependent monooxygenase [Citricoccus sp. I39-566]WMY78655.1 FAD-dependent monooxygenase [Citricoccus sp. I39-566]